MSNAEEDCSWRSKVLEIGRASFLEEKKIMKNIRAEVSAAIRAS
jgi:hypothetical protein